MKIAFWSNSSDKCGVSSNLAAVSVASVIRFPYTIVAFENHLSRNNLGCAYLEKPQADMVSEVGTNYYEGGGIEGLLRKIYREECLAQVLKPYLREIIHKHLYYIPQGNIIRSELFDYEFNHCIEPFFKLIEDFADISFIDTANRNNLSSKTILQEADLIVVNLYQDQSIIEDFFLNYSSLVLKSVFLISNYSHNSILNSKKISICYEIPIDRITIIPYNEMFQNAYKSGCVVEFISRNYECSKDNPNYHFIQAIKKAAYMTIKSAQIQRLHNGKEIRQCGR